MATHSSIIAWRSQWTEELHGLQYTGLQSIGHTRHTLITHNICGVKNTNENTRISSFNPHHYSVDKCHYNM